MDLLTISETQTWLIFTDLDGTLLDHHSYSFVAAQPALNRLKQLGIPVILNSSKTPAEIAQLANDLHLDTPQIAENGSIIFHPSVNKSHVLGADYQTICSVLDTLRNKHDYAFRGFHDWSAEDIAKQTGLSLQAAKNAAKRQGSEPLIWDDETARLDNFKQHLKENALTLKRGGRFWHVMGQTDKVKAMQHLKNTYDKNNGAESFVIALGDSSNDKDMLAAADIAIIVHNPEGTPFTLNITSCSKPQRIIKTKLTGPAGWNEAICDLLDKHTM